jgi:hypothetical protein
VIKDLNSSSSQRDAIYLSDSRKMTVGRGTNVLVKDFAGEVVFRQMDFLG